jgi:hypothetical protein
MYTISALFGENIEQHIKQIFFLFAITTYTEEVYTKSNKI